MFSFSESGMEVVVLLIKINDFVVSFGIYMIEYFYKWKMCAMDYLRSFTWGDGKFPLLNIKFWELCFYVEVLYFLIFNSGKSLIDESEIKMILFYPKPFIF